MLSPSEGGRAAAAVASSSSSSLSSPLPLVYDESNQLLYDPSNPNVLQLHVFDEVRVLMSVEGGGGPRASGRASLRYRVIDPPFHSMPQHLALLPLSSSSAAAPGSASSAATSAAASTSTQGSPTPVNDYTTGRVLTRKVTLLSVGGGGIKRPSAAPVEGEADTNGSSSSSRKKIRTA